MIALVPTITEQLSAPQFRNDLEQLNFVLVELFGADEVGAYEALQDLQDLLDEVSELPDFSAIAPREWNERRADFCRAAELYLDGRWRQPPADRAH